MAPENHPSNGSPTFHRPHGRKTAALSAAPTERKTIAQGKERSDAALGQESETTLSPEGAKEDGEMSTSWTRVALGKRTGMLGTIFRKAQNKIQDPAKLRRLIVA